MRFSAIYPVPAGGLCLSAGKHVYILTYFQTKVNKKTNNKNSPQSSLRTQRFYLFINRELARIIEPIRYSRLDSSAALPLGYAKDRLRRRRPQRNLATKRY